MRVAGSSASYRSPTWGLRWMLYVDGENITARAQETCKTSGLTLEQGRHYRRDVYFWITIPARLKLPDPTWSLPLQKNALRATYYTSASGDEQALDDIRRSLWDLGFTPVVFKRRTERGSKGVDIALTKDMLTAAFFDHYDVAVLATGDGDFEPVVHEIKRMGKSVHLVSFESGLSPSLKLACDWHHNLDGFKKAYPVAPSTPAT